MPFDSNGHDEDYPISDLGCKASAVKPSQVEYWAHQAELPLLKLDRLGLLGLLEQLNGILNQG